MIPLTVSSANYVWGDKKIQAVSASASTGKDGATHISIVNMDATKEQDITIELGDIPATNISGRILYSGKVQDHNSFDNPEKIKPTAFNKAVLTGKNITLSIPAFSVIVLTIK